MTYRYVNISGRPDQIAADQTKTRARNTRPQTKSKTLQGNHISDHYRVTVPRISRRADRTRPADPDPDRNLDPISGNQKTQGTGQKEMGFPIRELVQK